MFLFSSFMFVFCDLMYLINLIWFDIYILLISFVIRNQTRRPSGNMRVSAVIFGRGQYVVLTALQ